MEHGTVIAVKGKKNIENFMQMDQTNSHVRFACANWVLPEKI